MIGIPDSFGKRVFTRRPADDKTDAEWMEIWLSPSEPRWDHKPKSEQDGPFRVIRASTSDEQDVMYAFESHSELATALRAFCLRNLPTPGQRGAVLDVHNQMIVGWIDWHQPGDQQAEEERYIWVGCGWVFHLLAIIHNPIDAAFWERLALENR